MQQVGTTGKESSKKHAKEGPLSKSRRTRCLEEKQIKSKDRSKTTKESLKKHSRQQLWCKNPTKPRKPMTSRRKKTAIPSKKVETNLHRRHKANQLGIHPTILTRKNRQRGNSEETNRTIWIRW